VDAAPRVPLVDLTSASAPQDLDAALRDVGFLMLTGHGLDPALLTAARTQARAFFQLPAEAKARVAVEPAAYRGWVGPGQENNAQANDGGQLPDLKESFVFGAPDPPRDARAQADPQSYVDNRLPEGPGGAALGAALDALFHACVDVSARLVAVAERALGVPTGSIGGAWGGHHISSLVANHYPAGAGRRPAAGEWRIGPHTDFGGFTLLDREPGSAALQVQLPDGSWVDAPVVAGALTVNTGDLMALWSGGRWRSTWHRVVPPDPAAPAEELLSLVYFSDPDADALVRPVGQPDAEPVRCGPYLAAKLAAMTSATAA